jgi:hypothetical protein
MESLDNTKWENSLSEKPEKDSCMGKKGTDVGKVEV